jgi:2-polyprenyl-6-methoxyphenol hydroxylase-like FAD-dependent oxidoreductase
MATRGREEEEDPMAVSNRPAEVLVVGAGPTGLVLALWLKRLGVDVRVIDETAEPGTTSRALAVHARTLELYDQFGLAGEVVERGLKFAAANVWVRGRHVGRAAFGDIGEGLSPFPYILMYPQDEHEKLLIERLRGSGIEVERGTTLLDFDARGERVTARLVRPDGVRAECVCAYIAGCDGAHSRVRDVLGVGFPGGTYERIFYVADVEIQGPVANHELHVALDEAELLAVFPLKGEHTARLIGTVRRESEANRELGWEDVSRRAIERLKLTVGRIHWFSTYKVHHRVARHFRSGRAFLVGDAAHVHSPVGGQGMNTGIGDAVNLAWKLGAILRGRAGSSLLDSYEAERRAFAERLVATTDRAFTFVTRDGFLAKRVRLDLVPLLLPPLMEQKAVRRFLFRTVSQTMLAYRRSALSEGKAGSVHGGDRLPWAGGAENGPTSNNFSSLRSIEWQVHVYGRSSRELAHACADLGLVIHTFPWSSSAEHAGLAPNAAYLVRPDGYVGLADAAARPDRLKRYLEARGLVLSDRSRGRSAVQSDMIQS